MVRRRSGARRASLHTHRSSDLSLDPAHAAILFRDSRGVSTFIKLMIK